MVKDDQSPATKSDMRSLGKRIDQQFKVILDILATIQEDLLSIKEDTKETRDGMRILRDKILNGHELRIGACERRPGLAA
ncbi:hypothetical protein KKC44_03755 [Patescibacteria group bacterium]|nr:hypothetical protein [Patescibacteria group bacterium]